MAQNEHKLVNFSALSSFTGGNSEFARQLVTAFVSELDIFEAQIKETLSEEEFLAFRKAYHSISPSLQIMDIQDLIAALDEYKLSYTTQPESLSQKAIHIRQILIDVKGEVLKWKGF